MNDADRVTFMQGNEGKPLLKDYLHLLLTFWNDETFKAVVKNHRTVNLSGCYFGNDNEHVTSFMGALGKLEHLEVLDLQNNCLSEIDNELLLGLAKLPKVHTLYLSYSDIASRLAVDPDFKDALMSLFPHLENIFFTESMCLSPIGRKNYKQQTGFLERFPFIESMSISLALSGGKKRNKDAGHSDTFPSLKDLSMFAVKKCELNVDRLDRGLQSDLMNYPYHPAPTNS